VSFLRRVPGVSGLTRFLAARAGRAWQRDRTQLRGLRAAGNRLFRIATLVVRGVVAHRLSMLAASLTFFTVFSVVPMLVVVLWALKLLDHLPTPAAELPAQTQLLTGNQLLHVALGDIFASVRRAGEVTGLLGLLALLWVATKMFSFTERAVYTIAGAGQRKPKLSRALGYLGLLLMLPVVVGLAGLLQAAVQRPFAKQIRWVLQLVPGFELVVVIVAGFGVLWLAATLLYWAAVRARIPFWSASVGGVASALALPVVFWAYANLQLGVAKVSPLGSGFIAFPVFLMWSFSSWYAVLVGAEIAVAHHVDGVLAHGARAFRLDPAGEREASLALFVRLAARTRAGEPPQLADDDLARELRLPPQVVGNLCVRLVDRGLLAEVGHAFKLRFDPARTTVASLLDAVEHDPGLADAGATLSPGARQVLSAARGGPSTSLTLAELASQAG
jgi:membrane protein